MAEERLSRQQVNVVFASYLGWTLDAFDFFILAFVLREIAAEFAAPVESVAWAITLTLACRAIGAWLFGRLADRYGRRPILMLNVLCFSALEFASGLAPTLAALLVLRALYGVAMGGEWGVAASLTMESVPPRWRGVASGVLQAGYPSGFLLASLLYLALPVIGWRGMFMVGALPALLVLYVRYHVPESEDWKARQGRDGTVAIRSVLRRHAGLFAFAIVMMTAMNFLGHGSLDLYPSEFLGAQHHLPPDTISLIVIVANIGAIIGGIGIGALSQVLGRKRTILLSVLATLPVIPLWAFSTTTVMLAAGAFIMMFFIQGAWGVVPAYLNELSPAYVRSTFPGFTYQLGNFLAAANANIQIWFALRMGGDYGMVLAATVGVTAVVIAILAVIGPEPDRSSIAGAPGA